MNIYDRNGEPMSQEAFDAVPYRKRVLKKQTLIVQGEPVLVLTMWDGIDMADNEGPVPCPYSAWVHSHSFPDMLMAVPDAKRAMVAHEMMVGFVRAQGGRGGWRVPWFFITHAYRHPSSLKVGWINMAVTALILALQLSTLTLGILTGLNWTYLLSVVAGVVYGWWFRNSLKGLKALMVERREKRQVEKERREFENIIGPLR